MVMSRGLYSTARGEARLLTEVEELEVAGSELVLDERALADLRQRCARPQGGFVTAIRTGRISLRAVARGHASRTAVAAAGCASVSSRLPSRRALRSGEVNGETDVRPNGLALGELHGPFIGELVSAAVPMDSRRV